MDTPSHAGAVGAAVDGDLMPAWLRSIGPPATAALLLLAGAARLWQTGSGPTAAGALLGAGLLTAGIAIHDWTHHTKEDK